MESDLASIKRDSKKALSLRRVKMRGSSLPSVGEPLVYVSLRIFILLLTVISPMVV